MDYLTSDLMSLFEVPLSADIATQDELSAVREELSGAMSSVSGNIDTKIRSCALSVSVLSSNVKAVESKMDSLQVSGLYVLAEDVRLAISSAMSAFDPYSGNRSIGQQLESIATALSNLMGLSGTPIVDDMWNFDTTYLIYGFPDDSSDPLRLSAVEFKDGKIPASFHMDDFELRGVILGRNVREIGHGAFDFFDGGCGIKMLVVPPFGLKIDSLAFSGLGWHYGNPYAPSHPPTGEYCNVYIVKDKDGNPPALTFVDYSDVNSFEDIIRKGGSDAAQSKVEYLPYSDLRKFYTDPLGAWRDLAYGEGN